MTNKILEELKRALQPYLFFWDEWSQDDNCNLTKGEIQLINTYLESSFEIGMFEHFLFYNRAKTIKEVSRKLDLGLQIFKDFVIVKFLVRIIAMAKQNGYKKFLETPIDKLEIPYQLKNILKSFKAYTLQQLFIIYKIEDLSRGQIFKKIVEFQIYMKEKAIVSA